MAKIILLTGEDCSICHEAEEKFREEFKEELDSGEAKVINLDQDEAMQQVWMEADLPFAPLVLLVTDENKVLAHFEPDDVLRPIVKEALPPTAEGIEQPQVEGLVLNNKEE